MSKEHVLKTWDVYYDAVDRGDKMFEVRRDDRGFQKGDVLVLRRMKPDYNGAWIEDRTISSNSPIEIRVRVKYILTGGQLGIEPGYVVMALKRA